MASENRDPEAAFTAQRFRVDAVTLREVVEDPEPLKELRNRLTDKLDGAFSDADRARLYGLRAAAHRLLGDLDAALADAQQAVSHAESTGQFRRIAIARIRLAHVRHWRGEHAEADRHHLLAESADLPDRLRAAIHQQAAACCYEQGRFLEACQHLDAALKLGKADDWELVEAVQIALGAIERKVKESGFGPYPRSREEILQASPMPVLWEDPDSGLLGYTDAGGRPRIPARYADALAFRDGVAWVRKDRQPWELIAASGTTVIPAASGGYRQVISYSEGLAWVYGREPDGWQVIDKHNTLVIPPAGYDEVHEFRQGLAVVRQNGLWGAIDAGGSVVVPFAFDGFRTATVDGRHLAGFTDDGLAVVERAGRRGVVDQRGRLIVPPVYRELYLHPLAYLVVTDGTGPTPFEAQLNGAERWGALDRKGGALLDPVYPNRRAVQRELDSLLTDTRPVL